MLGGVEHVGNEFIVKLAQRVLVPLARLRERAEERETGMASSLT
jgi:hypothetical protein